MIGCRSVANFTYAKVYLLNTSLVRDEMPDKENGKCLEFVTLYRGILDSNIFIFSGKANEGSAAVGDKVHEGTTARDSRFLFALCVMNKETK